MTGLSVTIIQLARRIKCLNITAHITRTPFGLLAVTRGMAGGIFGGILKNHIQ